MAKVRHEKQGKMKAVIKFVSVSSRTSSDISSPNSPQRTRLIHNTTLVNQPDQTVRNKIHMKGLFEASKDSNEDPVWVHSQEEVRKAKNQIRKLLEKRAGAKTGCLSFEKSMKVEKEPGTLQEPTPSGWFSTRSIQKTYTRSKKETPSVRNLQELKHETKCLRKFEEVEETTTENLDFLTSQDPLMCVKEEVINECEEATEVYILEEEINDKENVEQVEGGHGASSESDFNIFNVDSIVYDHSYTHSPMSKDQHQGNRGIEENELPSYEHETFVNEYDDKITIEDDNLNKHAFHIFEEKTEVMENQDQGNRGIEENEPLPYEQERLINEYDEKLTIEDDNLNKYALEIFQEKTEVAETKETIMESTEEKQKVENNSKPDAPQSEKSYKCAGCQKILDLKQCLKIHMVVHKEKKYIHCEDCFKNFKRTRSSLAHTLVQKRISRDRILREGMHRPKAHPRPRQFLCDICNKQFAAKYIMLNHKKTHFADNNLPYKCEVCNQSYISPIYLARHIKNSHPNERPFSCNGCNKSFKTKYHLQRHEDLIKNEGPFVCNVCGQQFHCKINLKQHCRSHRESFPFQCEFCNKKYKHNFLLNVHKRTHTGERPFACEICDKRFDRKYTFMQHRHIHSFKRPFSCEICNKQYATKYKLRQHKKVHMPVQDRPFACEVCNRRFIQHAQLVEHIQYHTNERPFQCKVCNKSYVGKYKLARHELVHKKKEDPCVCEVCGKQFKSVINLKQHMRIHCSDRPFVCKICNKGFKRRSYFTYHATTHSNEFPFTCEICGKKFKRKRFLLLHMEIHSNGPFVCKICTKSFRQKASFKLHERIHTHGLFECEVCGKQYERKGTLMMHKSIHSGERLFACEICGKCFRIKGHLTQHMRFHTDERPFLCEFCGKRFRFNGERKQHSCTPTSGNLFMCEICGKQLKTKAILAAHKKNCLLTCDQGSESFENSVPRKPSPTENFKFLCDICGRQIKQESYFRDHMRSHTNNFPFSCGMCGKRFKRKILLAQHEHFHIRERKFGCDVCGKRYIYQPNLQQHKRIHSGERPFKCAVCGKGFVYKFGLVEHKRIHEREVMSDT